MLALEEAQASSDSYLLLSRPTPMSAAPKSKAARKAKAAVAAAAPIMPRVLAFDVVTGQPLTHQEEIEEEEEEGKDKKQKDQGLVSLPWKTWLSREPGLSERDAAISAVLQVMYAMRCDPSPYEAMPIDVVSDSAGHHGGGV